MYTNGIILSIAASDATLAGKLLSETESSFESRGQAPAKFEALRKVFGPKSTAAKARESRSFAIASCEPCAK